MANNFNIPMCRALWNFEPGAMLVDSRGLNADLTAYSPVAPAADAAVYKEGASSVKFTRASKQFYYLNDVDLPAGFPFKAGDAAKLMTVSFWIRFPSYLASGQLQSVLTKGVYALDPCFEAFFGYYTSSAMRMTLKWGLTATTETSWTPAYNFAKDTWYHICIRIDGTASKIWKVRIYNDTSGATNDYTGTPGDVLRISADRRWVIGAYDSGVNSLEAYLDELLFFNAMLSDAELVAVKGGTFDFGDSRLVSRYRFESGALTTDSKGTSTLKLPGVESDVVNHRYGSGCLDLTGNSYLRLADAGGDALFPMKIGDPWLSAGFSGWFNFYYAGSGTLFGRWVGAQKSHRIFLGTANHLFYSYGYSTPSNGYDIDTGIVIIPGRWYFIAVSMDWRNVTNSYAWHSIYVYDSVDNSVQVYGPIMKTNCRISTVDFTIGADQDGTNAICAKIDQLAVFDQWLFPAEQESLRKNESKGFNDVLNDAGLQGYWDFEDIPGSLIDEKNSIVLTAYPVEAPLARGDSGLYRKSWAKGMHLDRNAGADRYFSIADASLSAGYPLKSGDAAKLFSVTMWVKPANRMPTYKRFLYSKWNTSTSARSVGLYILDNRVYICWAKSGDGYTLTERNTGIDLLPGEWYHVGLAIDGVAKQLYFQAYRVSTGTLEYDAVVTPNVMPYAINVTTVKVAIGQPDNAGATTNLDGLIDEIAVFASKISAADMDSIRAGTYDLAGDANCKALWRFEPGALTTDSKGTNTLTNTGAAASGGEYREGAGSVRLYSSNNPFLVVEDAALPANFPLKFGAGTTKFSFCGWVRGYDWASGNTSQVLFVKGQPGQFTLGVYLYSFSIYAYLRVYWGWGGGTELFQSPNIYPIQGRWLHIGLAFDIVAKTCYMRVYDYSDHDLPADTSFTFTNDLWIGPGPLGIGGQLGTNESFDGVMDEMQFFNRILSSEEMELLQSRSFTPMDMQKVHHVSAYYEYGPLGVPPNRIFPVPHPRWKQQSQMGRRVFPVVA